MSQEMSHQVVGAVEDSAACNRRFLVLPHRSDGERCHVTKKRNNCVESVGRMIQGKWRVYLVVRGLAVAELSWLLFVVVLA